MLIEEKTGKENPNLNILSVFPDAVNVAKCKRQRFSNCFPWVDDARVNLAHLRELRNGPSLYSTPSEKIPLSAVRNRDPKDVDSILQILDVAVRDALKDNAVVVTNTVVPEKYRITDDNKKGILKSDVETGKVVKVRASHYPASVAIEVDSLDCPVGTAYNNGVLYIAESRKSAIVYKDLTGETVVEPSKLTVEQLLNKLKDAAAWDDSDKKIVKSCRKSWMRNHRRRRQWSLTSCS